MNMKCIVCGKDAEIESFCGECWLKGKSLFDLKDFEIKICECSSILLEGKWKKFYSFDDILREEIEKKIIPIGKIKKCNIEFNIAGTIIKADVKCTGKISPCKVEKEQEKRITIMIRKGKCDECQKDAASYYEAVIQLRVPKLIDKIEKASGEALSSVHDVRGGFDLYLKSNARAKTICSGLQQKGYSVVRSVIFVTRKNNKNIYRNYYSVKEG